MTKTLLAIAAICLSGHAQAALYKCKVAGQTTFQDKPCAGASTSENQVQQSRDERVRELGKQIEFGAAAAAPAAAPAAPVSAIDANRAWLRKTEAEQQRNALRKKISNLEADNRETTARMNTQLDLLRAKKLAANNNLAGATYEQSISAEMQAVTAAAETKQRANDAAIARLREDLAKL